jgi:N utilization substance protein A
MKLFEQEVPEIRDGIIEIKQCSREPGSRAKMAVISKDRDIDPVGACVGMKGVRVQQVIQELKGEKIDIIPWSDNPMVFARSALSPAEISSIRIDERTKAMEIMVEDSQLSLAIGKRGQNVRLAAQITGWKLDIISKTKLQKRVQDAIANLMNLEGMNDTQARALAQVSVLNIRQLAETGLDALAKVPGFEDREVAERMKARAQQLVDEGSPIVNGVQAPTTIGAVDHDAKAQASEKLKEMIQQAEGATAGGTAE